MTILSEDALQHDLNNAKGRKILAIFAHPDDEAFTIGGTLAAYAAAGAEVRVVCATRGEAGKISDPNMTVEDLGQQRQAELEEACRQMGILPPLWLGYHDSGRHERVRKDDPKALLNVEPLDLVGPLLDVIAAEQPEVIITFDPHGGYGHIDHLQIHRASTAAFLAAGHLPHPPQRLFYVVQPHLRIEQLAALNPGQQMKVEHFGVDENTAALKVDVRAWLPAKFAAIAAHGTQVGSSSFLGSMEAEKRKAFEEQLAREWFALGGTRAAVKNWPLGGLFDGLERAKLEG